MTRRTNIILAAAAAAAAGVAVAGTVAARHGENEQPITGDALVRASEVALAHTGGGTVTGTEVGDEDSLYEVEVTLDDGSQVDVQLDEDFQVVAEMPDRDTGTDDESDG